MGGEFCKGTPFSSGLLEPQDDVKHGSTLQQRNINLRIGPVLPLSDYFGRDLRVNGHQALTTALTRDLPCCARGEAKHTVKQDEVCARTRSGCASTVCSCGDFVHHLPGPSSDPRASGRQH